MGPMLGKENPIFMACLRLKLAWIVEQKALFVDDTVCERLRSERSISERE